MIDIRAKIKQILLPQACLLCLAESQQHLLCARCLHDLPGHGQTACPICGLSNGNGEVCGACLRHAPSFDATFAALDYRFPADAMLQRYKYSGLLAVGKLMGELIARGVGNGPRPDYLIAMPLHTARLKERGFNQALEIARVVARELDIPLLLDACSRVRPTQPQAGLPMKERIRNMRGVFSCHRRLDAKHVALLDDVMTTGASLDALARAVKEAGAARVECWVAARTPRD